MKNVISAKDIEKLAESGTLQLEVVGGRILTPLARDRAKELGVTIIKKNTSQTNKSSLKSPYRTSSDNTYKKRRSSGRVQKHRPPDREIRQIVRRVLSRLMPEQKSTKLVDLITQRVIQKLNET